MSDDIVERLRAHLASDHKRGCGGRCYSCDCGYDNSTEGLLAKAANEIERLREAITMAANRLDIAVAGNHGDGPACRNCVEIALSYLRPSKG